MGVKRNLDTAVLVGVMTEKSSEEESKSHLQELKFLATTLSLRTEKIFTQKISLPNPNTFIGSGKVEEVKEFIDENKIGNVIFDDDLSPSQQRNLEKILDCEVIDRTNLILNIFEQNARTRQSKFQIELARYQYLLPRLTGMWTHLSRQKGGIGMKGAGEKEIETDRRIVTKKISLLKKKLEKIDNKVSQQQKNRIGIPRVSLVGYTNTGKSTLMNLICKEKLLSENKLFATLDTTVRRVSYRDLNYLLSDTVGFIRKLPPQLVESFRSTLEETVKADLLLHVVDISSETFEEQMDEVNRTLQILGTSDIPILTVFNKIDQYKFVPSEEDDLNKEDSTSEEMLEKLQKTWMKNLKNNCIFISALKKKGIQELREKIYEAITHIATTTYFTNFRK